MHSFFSRFNKLLSSHVVVEYAIISVTLLIVGLLFTWPSGLYLTTHLIGDGGDHHQFSYNQVALYERITSGEYFLSHSYDLRYPVGFDLGVGFDGGFVVFVGVLLLFFVGQPLAFNISVLIAYLVSALFSYILAKQLTKSKLVAFIGAVVYGFSFYVLARGAGHNNLLFTAGWPLFAYAWLRIIKSKHISFMHSIVSAFGLFFLTLGSLQYALMLSFVFPLVVVAFAVFHPAQFGTLLKKISTSWKPLLASHLVFASFFIWYVSPYMNAFVSGNWNEKGSVHEIALDHDVELMDFLVPNSFMPLFITFLTGKSEKIGLENSVFVGWIEIVFLFCFLLSRYRFSIKGFLGSVLFSVWTVALGVTEFGMTWAYQYLAHFVPFAQITEPGRFVVVIQLIIMVMIVLILDGIRDKSRQFLLALIVLAVVIIERVPYRFFVVPVDMTFFSAIDQVPGTAVMNVPFNIHEAERDAIPTFTSKKIVDGYFHWAANTPDTRRFIDQPNAFIHRLSCEFGDLVMEIAREKYPFLTDDELALLLNTDLIVQMQKYDIQAIAHYKNKEYKWPQCQTTSTRVDELLQQGKRGLLPKRFELIYSSETKDIYVLK